MEQSFKSKWYEDTLERVSYLESEISRLGQIMSEAEFKSRIYERSMRYFKSDNEKEMQAFIQNHINSEDAEYSRLEAEVEELIKEKRMLSAVIDELKPVHNS